MENETYTICPGCGKGIKLAPPQLPFIIPGKKQPVQFLCDRCGHAQNSMKGKCEKCGGKSWGVG